MTDSAGEFEAHRERLVAIATRVLGSRADAEDVVQEAWLRLARQEPATIGNVAGWLTTVVGRLSIDALRSAKSKAEVAFDVDPVVRADEVDQDGDPESTAIQAEALGLALLTVLGSLQPDERLAFVLHDVFALPFAEIGPIIDRSADAAKMTASRARRKVHGAAAGKAESARQQRAVVDAFLTAARDGDFEALLSILDPDVIWEIHTPRGVTTRTGSEEIVRAVEHGRRRPGIRVRRVLVDGRPGILAWGPSGRPISLMACTIEDGRMTRIASLVDGARLARMDLPAS